MPIKIPTIKRSGSLNTGGSPQLGVPNVASTAPNVGKEIQQVAEALRKREVEMEIQHDNAVAQSTYIKFRGEANARLRNYLDLEGADVDGSQAEYTKWYDEQSGKVSAELGSRRQQELFGNSAARARFADLNSLSAHQSKELKLFKDKTADSRYASARNSVELHAGDEEFIEGEVKEVAKAINNANPGVDNSLDISNKAAALYLIDIQTLAKSDPAKAKIMLEARRGKLAGNYEKAKDVVDREYAYALAKSSYPEDFDAQISFIQSMGEGLISRASKTGAMSRIRVERAEQEKKDADAYAEKETVAEQEVYGHLRSGEFAKAQEAIRGADIKNKKKYSLEVTLNKATNAGSVQKDDPEARLFLLQNYRTMTEASIIEMKDVTPATKEHFLTKREKAIKENSVALNKKIDKAERSIISQVRSGSQMFGFLPQSVESAYDAADMLEDALAEAATLKEKMDMLDPDSSKYVVRNIVQIHKMTPDAQVKAKAEEFMPRSSSKPTRIPGESPADFVARLREWKRGNE